MPTHPLTKQYPVGTTHRITVATVRETPCTIDANTPEQIYRYWQEVIATQSDHEPDKESLVVVMLTTRLRPFAWHRVSLGTLNETSAHPREIFRPVIASGAYAFCMMHNHPSGDPSPSRADINITAQIKKAGELLSVSLIDHVIVGEPERGRSAFYSFRAAGLI